MWMCTGVCKTTVGAKSPSVLCTKCHTWTHSKCTRLSRSEFVKLATKIKQQGFNWKCDACILEVSVITECDSNIDDGDDEDENITMQKLKLQLSKLTITFEKKFDNFKSIVEKSIADVRKDVANLSKQCKHTSEKCVGYENRLTSLETKLKYNIFLVLLPQQKVLLLNLLSAKDVSLTLLY